MMEKEIFALACQLGQVLIQKKIKIVTAESCTGGGVGQAITDVSGSSAWFDRGFISYSNQSKIQLLQVNSDSLDQFGAVSEQIAVEMASGAFLMSDANIAVSVTGIAGPGGGSVEKPVGTVFIAVNKHGHTLYSKHYQFSGNRCAIRKLAIKAALSLSIKSI